MINSRSWTLRLDACSVSKNAVHGRYSLGEMLFNTSVWYDSVDFDLLQASYGQAAIDRIAFHIVAFEAMKLVSFRPRIVDWGICTKYVDDAFATIWRSVYSNVWAQWRFETGSWQYIGPEFAADSAAAAPLRLCAPAALGTDTLLFHGGGKDSLLAGELLADIDEPFDTLTYAASLYGPMARQHDLIEQSATRGHRGKRHRMWIVDDFSSIPVAALRPDLITGPAIQAETPSTLFAALPYSLQYGYTSLCFAHERSADAHQALSPGGAPINHQWGKSSTAERLLDEYIRDRLVAEVASFSLLKPVHDVAIFGLLRRWQVLVPLAHSCNIAKPWCLNCAKCLYVWLGYAAFFDRQTVQKTFGAVNPLQEAANIDMFRALIGLEDRLPFDCIGEAGETALYMLMCRQRGYTGAVIAACKDVLDGVDWATAMRRYLKLHAYRDNLPRNVTKQLSQIFSQQSEITADFISAIMELRPVNLHSARAASGGSGLLREGSGRR